MPTESSMPQEQDVLSIVSSMTGFKALFVERMATGDQNFVYSVKTNVEEYILRLTRPGLINKFHSAIAWQNMLLPLGVPLAEFINIDLESKYSPFPALLMKRLPGDDLINVYPTLTAANKKCLANEMKDIQALCFSLPESSSYGILDGYDDISGEKSWFDFLSKRLELFEDIFARQTVFNPGLAKQTITIAQDMRENFNSVKAIPFLWDASERNVIVYQGKISGIVDVDEICFGDPLLVIALTSTCLELEGYDTLYTDYWSAELHLDKLAQQRLAFYKLFYALAFMRKHGTQTNNNKKIIYDTDILLHIFNKSFEQITLFTP